MIGVGAGQAATELRRPPNICSASVTILSTISAGRRNIMDQADGLAGNDGGNVEISRRLRRRVFGGDRLDVLQ